MSNTYSVWLGRQVVLHIETRESRVPLQGQVVNESSDALRFRIDGRWDVDIFKEMIVGVEADNYGPLEPGSLGLSDASLLIYSTKRLQNKLKTRLLRFFYWLAYHLADAAVYTRQPFVRYPYMNPPSEILELTKQLLSVEAAGAVVEVGCHQGWTTCFLVEALMEQGVKRDYVCIDTFAGFTPEDVAFEYKERGKAAGLYDECFLINDPAWLKASLSRFGYANVSVQKADAKTFDYQKLGKIAFALVDLDLYRPVRVSLERIIPHMVPGGVAVVDDCNAKNDRWDGAYQAYTEFCKERNIRQEIVCGKLGIIRT